MKCEQCKFSKIIEVVTTTDRGDWTELGIECQLNKCILEVDKNEIISNSTKL